MDPLKRRVEARLRNEVCNQCRQSAGIECCDYQTETACPLVMRVDEIIDAVGQVSDYSLEPYHDRVRDAIRPPGVDPHRGNCAIDTYFPQIVSIVEQEFKTEEGAS